MYKYLFLASLLSLGHSGIIDTGSSLGGGNGWHADLDLGTLGGNNNGYAHGSLEDEQSHGGGGSIGGDYHHGVSVVGGGGGGKGVVIDLSDHGGDGHNGIYGGSFVASSKYSAAGHEGGNGGGHAGGHGGYGVSEGTGFAEHYSDVLGASQSLGGEYEALSHGSIGGGDEGLSNYHASISGGHH